MSGAVAEEAARPGWAHYVAAFVVAGFLQNLVEQVLFIIMPRADVTSGQSVWLSLVLTVLWAGLAACVWIIVYRWMSRLRIRKVLPWLIVYGTVFATVASWQVWSEPSAEPGGPILYAAVVWLYFTLWIGAFTAYFWRQGRL
jgi:hypothetical protein